MEKQAETGLGRRARSIADDPRGWIEFTRTRHCGPPASARVSVVTSPSRVALEPTTGVWSRCPLRPPADGDFLLLSSHSDPLPFSPVLPRHLAMLTTRARWRRKDDETNTQNSLRKRGVVRPRTKSLVFAPQWFASDRLSTASARLSAFLATRQNQDRQQQRTQRRCLGASLQKPAQKAASGATPIFFAHRRMEPWFWLQHDSFDLLWPGPTAVRRGEEAGHCIEYFPFDPDPLAC